MGIYNPPPPGGGGLTNINISAGTTSNNLSNIVFSNLNGLTFGLNGSTLTGSVAAGGGDAIRGIAAGGSTQSTSTVLFQNSNGLSFGFRAGASSTEITGSYTVPSTAGLISAINVSGGTTSNNLSAITFSNLNGISFGLNASTMTASHNAITSQSNQQMTLFATGNTTQSSTGTTNASSMIFRGEGIASIGITGGSVVVSVPSGGGGLTNINISAGTTSQNLSNVVFSNLNGVSFGLNGSTVTASVAAGGGAGQTLRSFMNFQPATSFTIGNASMSFWPFTLGGNLTATRAMFIGHMSGASGSTGAVTISLGLYTMSQSTASLASSGSTQISWTSGTNSTASTANFYGNKSGTRYRDLSLASWGMTPGNYLLGFWWRTTNAGTWTFWGHQSTVSLVSEVFTSVINQYLPGFSTSSFTTALPASINVTNTQYVRTAASAYKFPAFTLMGSI